MLTVCRPSGAFNCRPPSPTVSTVGYAVTSLRDFRKHKKPGTPPSLRISPCSDSKRLAFGYAWSMGWIDMRARAPRKVAAG